MDHDTDDSGLTRGFYIIISLISCATFQPVNNYYDTCPCANVGEVKWLLYSLYGVQLSDPLRNKSPSHIPDEKHRHWSCLLTRCVLISKGSIYSAQIGGTLGRIYKLCYRVSLWRGCQNLFKSLSRHHHGLRRTWFPETANSPESNKSRSAQNKHNI